MKVVCFDLDDTLYAEVDYLESAYKEIVAYALEISGNNMLPASEVYNEMLNAYYSQQNAFECLNEILDLECDIQSYLTIYRNHKPNISLSYFAENLFCELREMGCILGVITDGRSVQQRNKIEALGINKYVDTSDIIISEEFGSEKPSMDNFRYFMNKYPYATEYIYIGDNISKDFVAPNKLGWKSFCVLDSGRNVHTQIFDIPAEYMPSFYVAGLEEIVPILIK